MKKNKKNSHTKSPEVVTAAIPAAQKPRKSSIGNAGDILTILFCCLYFIVEFIPNLGATDDQGPQWVYLVLSMGLPCFVRLGNSSLLSKQQGAICGSSEPGFPGIVFQTFHCTVFPGRDIGIFFNQSH